MDQTPVTLEQSTAPLDSRPKGSSSIEAFDGHSSLAESRSTLKQELKR